MEYSWLQVSSNTTLLAEQEKLKAMIRWPGGYDYGWISIQGDGSLGTGLVSSDLNVT